MITNLGAALVVIGTYILSRKVFADSPKLLINLKFKDLPQLIKIVIILFGYQEKFENKQLWQSKCFPMGPKLTSEEIIEIISPFIGFFMILFGTILWCLKI